MKTLIVFCLLCILLQACAPPVEAQLATSLAGTQGARRLEQTAADATQNAMPTRTLTPRPTKWPTYTATPTLLMELLDITLTQADLPDTFTPFTFDEMGITEADMLAGMKKEGLVVSSSFVFLDTRHYQIVSGLVFVMPSRLTRAQLDAMIHRPEDGLDIFVKGFPADQIIESEVLEMREPVGDLSAALTIVVQESSERYPMHMDYIIFRREYLGCMLLVQYIEGEEPLTPMLDLAQIMDAKFQAALP